MVASFVTVITLGLYVRVPLCVENAFFPPPAIFSSDGGSLSL